MNNKALTMSVVMAVIAVFFVQSYVSSIEEKVKKDFGTKLLVIKAKKDIREMETINETQLQLDLVPKDFIQPGSFFFPEQQDKQAKLTMKDLAGTIAIVPIRQGEQLTRNKVSEPNMRTGLSPQIAPGKRAVAVPVNEVSGVGKLLKPGDRVDLIAVMDTGAGTKDAKIAKTVLQDVVVLAVGKSLTNNVARSVEVDPITGKERIKSLTEDTSFTSVTLEVEPAHVQTLALIMANGDTALSLALRNNDDTDRVSYGSTTFYDVLGLDGARVRAPANRR